MRTRSILVAALAASALHVAAGAQVSALKNHNSNAPVDVDADRIEVQDRADRAVFVGNVRVRQGDLTMNAARVTVAYTNTNGNTQVDRMDASGGVTMVSPSERATGNYAIYDVNRRLLTMLGNVVLDRAGSQVRGGRLLINLDTGRASVDGSGVGGGSAAGAPGSVDRSPGRVSGHFSVRQQGAAQPPANPPAK